MIQERNTPGEPRTSKPSQVRRLTREGSGVATVNMRASLILPFWSSLATLVPVEAGWYLHAASVAGRTSTEDGERQLDAGFDLKDSQVRWQHARISSIGRADLPLETNRRYVFYITQKEASREDLLDRHLPWPFRLRGPQTKDESAVLVFIAWPLELDHHCDVSLLSGRKKARDRRLLHFDTWEHQSSADAPAAGGKSVQAMVDMWAFRGLIDGGAVIHELGNFDEWKFWCPHEESGATPINPYALPGSSGDPMEGHWHYVIPEKDADPDTKAERPWTASALKRAIKSGRAVALTVGEMLMLAGDCYETPEQMTTDTDRWKNPVNIMRIYWDARQWLEGRKKLPASATGFERWQDYLQRHGVVYLVFELLMGNPDNLGREALNEMESVSKGPGADAKKDLRPPVRGLPPLDPKAVAKLKQERALREAFDHLVARARRVDGMVDFLRKASGPSLFTEIQFLAQTLGMDARGKPGGEGWKEKAADSYRGLTLGWIQYRLPWLADSNPKQELAAAGFTQDEIHYFETKGLNDQLVQFIITNGRYAHLALYNHPHFSEDGLNVENFDQYHRKALELVGAQCGTPGALHPIPGRALLHTAFGCHFLTDAFSASHMRVPRKKLGPLTSKMMHDIDGLVGLWVYNSFGTYQDNIWYAFGDTYLHAVSQKDKQQQLLPPKGKLDPEANFYYAADAVGSAFKQLHYQAHAFRQTSPTQKIPGILSSTIQMVLDANGPIPDPGAGMQEKRSADDVLKSQPDLPDPNDARYLRWESLSPGSAGLRGGYFWSRLSMTDDERIDYMNKLVPVPLPSVPAGSNAPESRTDVPSSIHERVNIPPLYSKDGQLISGYDNTNGSGDLYDIVTSTTDDAFHRNGQRLIDDYKGFILRINWGPFDDSVFDSKELRIKFDSYYFLTKFFKDVQGLEALMDPKLLDVYNSFKHETS